MTINKAKAVQNGFLTIFCGKAPSHCISQGRTSSAPMPFSRSVTAATAAHAQDNRGKQQPTVKATNAWQDVDIDGPPGQIPESQIGTSTPQIQQPMTYDTGLVFRFIMSSDFSSELGCSARLTLTCFLMVGGHCFNYRNTMCHPWGMPRKQGFLPQNLRPQCKSSVCETELDQNPSMMAREYSTDMIWHAHTQ